MVGAAQFLDDASAGRRPRWRSPGGPSRRRSVQPCMCRSRTFLPARGLDHDVDGRLSTASPPGAGGNRQLTAGAVAGPCSLPLRWIRLPAPTHPHRAVGTQHPGNIGSAARAMKTMGLHRLAGGADTSRTAKPMLAAGARDVLDAGARRWPRRCHRVRGGCTARARRGSIRRARRRRRCEPCAGTGRWCSRERTGLENELQLCHAASPSGLVPATALNLAASVQVLAYELRLMLAGGGRRRRGTRPAGEPCRDGGSSTAGDTLMPSPRGGPYARSGDAQAAARFRAPLTRAKCAC